MSAIIAWLLNSTLGRVAIGAVAIVAAFFAFKAWLSVHDASVANTARSGYVLVAERVAAEAKAAEIQRQLEASRISLASFQKRADADAIKDKADDQKRENEIKSYELLLSEANRRCSVDQSDIDWLTK